MPPESYFELLFEEMRTRAGEVGPSPVSTLYFGGGTPSLVDSSHILASIRELANLGFPMAPDAEITIEIDPATMSEAKLQEYLKIGINRFSVGVQTFNARLLNIAGRKHTSKEAVEILTLLKNYGVNYSFDLLFALPSQTLEEVRMDVATAMAFNPSHMSAYCLTVPESHPMARGRAPDEEQARMFELIESELLSHGLQRYEISNFSKPGFESRHNLLYWTDRPYWGLGTGAHSYFPQHRDAKWGARLWNAPSIGLWEKQVRASASLHQSPWSFSRDLPREQVEILHKHQSLTDFCHTSLRRAYGLEENALRLKYGDAVHSLVRNLMDELMRSNLVEPTEVGWKLSSEGRLLADVVFEKLTFLLGETGPE